MKALDLASFAGLLVLSEAQAAAPNGAIFIPRNGAVEGRAGRAHVLFDATAGGAMALVEGEWPALTNIARAALVFKAQPAGATAPVEVSQEFDRSPEIICIEEGNQRAGVRVLFKLFDKAQRYWGHGMTETWLYPNGEIFITAAASFEGMMPNRGGGDTNTLKVHKAAGQLIVAAPRPGSPDNETVTEAAIRIEHAANLKAMIPGRGAVAGPLRFDDQTIPERAINLGDERHARAAVYWMTGKNEYLNVIYRAEGGSPTYYRWPVYLPQAYWGGALRDIAASPGALELRWLDGAPAAAPNPSFVAVFRLIAPTSPEMVNTLVAAEKPPLKLTVEGGLVHGTVDGYNDLEGAYEIRKTNNPVKIFLPPDTAGRTVRLKVIGIDATGNAIAARLNGQPVVPHLTAEGGIADDPLAPIREQPEGAADMALFVARLGARPQVLEVRAEPGVQLAYQTRDRWRTMACFTSRGGGRYPGFRFSLVDGRLRNMRAYGRSDWALTENLLTWFPACGFTPEQMLDQLTDFEILKNGPREAEFRYVSRNANQRVQSEYRVVVPADSPAMQIDVTATFTVLQSWPYEGCQFFDVFPFRGVWPQDWWYDWVLWLAPDGRWKTLDTKARTFEGDKNLSRLTGGGFFALYSADRGNMLMLTKNFKPALPVEHVICGNYVDYHMSVEFVGPDGKPRVPDKGFTLTMQYDLALWGDGKATRDQLIEIGKQSLKAGRLVLPGK
jgi:hypothetical protein